MCRWPRSRSIPTAGESSLRTRSRTASGVMAQMRRRRVHRREVLDRDDHAKRVRALEDACEGALLELRALADARTGGARGVSEVEAVVGDERGTRLRGVVEQAVEG